MRPPLEKPRTHAQVVVRTVLISMVVFVLLFLMELKTGWTMEQIAQSAWMVAIVFGAAMLRVGARDKKSDRLWLMGMLGAAFAGSEKLLYRWVERLMHPSGPVADTKEAPKAETEEAPEAADSDEVHPDALPEPAKDPDPVPDGSAKLAEEPEFKNWKRQDGAWLYDPHR
jgi:hypothetical protein